MDSYPGVGTGPPCLVKLEREPTHELRRRATTTCRPLNLEPSLMFDAHAQCILRARCVSCIGSVKVGPLKQENVELPSGVSMQMVSQKPSTASPQRR